MAIDRQPEDDQHPLDQPSESVLLLAEHSERYRRIPWPVDIPSGGLQTLPPEDLRTNHAFLVREWDKIVKDDKQFAAFVHQRFTLAGFPDLPPLPGQVTIAQSNPQPQTPASEPNRHENAVCHHCGTKGHIQRNCPLKPQGGGTTKPHHRGKRGGHAVRNNPEITRDVGRAIWAAIAEKHKYR